MPAESILSMDPRDVGLDGVVGSDPLPVDAVSWSARRRGSVERARHPGSAPGSAVGTVNGMVRILEGKMTSGEWKLGIFTGMVLAPLLLLLVLVVVGMAVLLSEPPSSMGP